MAKVDLELNFYSNTPAENERILQKLRSRSKNDNKSALEWNKIFTKLNSTSGTKGAKNLKCAKQSNTAGQNNTVNNPIYGPIVGIPSGSWWGIRMDCSRDQVHRPFDNDIEEGNYGVTSICTSHMNTNNDVDFGTLLTFTSGEYLSTHSRKLNDPLLNNFKNHIPLRLVRSYNLANEFAPKTGYRYDGLYIVASFWIGVCVNSKKYYKFALTRLNCQESPVWSMPTRVSKRLSSQSEQNTILRTACGSLRCHNDLCLVQHSPQKEQKKINMEKLQSVNKLKSLQNNINSNNSDNFKQQLQDCTKDSTIVMRHVSKKTDTASPFQPLTPMTYSPKPASSDLQNMNISIRTEFYDSSPNPQEVLRKSTPMTFYKVQRMDNNKVINKNIRSNTPDAMNLNVFGPDKDNLIQESQIQMRKSISKDSPIFTNNTIKENCAIKNTGVILKNDSKILNNKLKDIQSDNKLNADNIADVKRVIKINNNMDIDVQKSNSLESKNSLRNSSKLNLTTSGSNELLNKTSSNLPEAFVELESMTPEQMLNLIMKKRFNPTGKLLMGSIIGLPTNDSCLVNVNGSLKIIEKKNGDNKNNKSNSNNKNNNKNGSSSTNMNKSQAIKISQMEMKKNTTKDKTCNNNKLRKSQPKTSSTAIKRDYHYQQTNKNERQKNRDTLSKSSVIKRRRNELAKLTINANFMTNLRGQSMQTRTMSNRRLRCPKIILNKKKEFPGFVTNFNLTKKSKRSRITKKSHVLTKLQKNLKSNSKIKDVIKSDGKITKAQNNKLNYVNTRNNNNHHNNINNSNNSNNNNNNGSTSEKKNFKLPLNKIFEAKKVEKAVGDSNITMIDVATQCSLTKDASTLVNMERHQRNQALVKVEWIDLVDDVKSELNELNLNSNKNNHSLSTVYCCDNQVQTLNDDDNDEYSQTTNTINKHTGMYSTEYLTNENSYIIYNTNNECGSAFVPVNLSERDLRVVRLRSIGFKPIESYEITDNNTCYTNYYATNSSSCNVKRVVLTREVNEQYNKYTSEENSIVGYMDNELHYQDIEAEDADDDDDDYDDNDDEDEDVDEEVEDEEEEIKNEKDGEDVEVELEIEDNKEKNSTNNSSGIICKTEYTKKRKYSSSDDDNDDEDDNESDRSDNNGYNNHRKEKLPWRGWNRLVKIKR